MAVLLRVYDPTTDVLLTEIPLPGSLSISYGLNSSAQFSGEIPENWPKRDSVVVGYPVVIYLENTPLITGTITRLEPSLNYTTRFDGVGALDSLYASKKFPLAYYEDKPLLGVLVELLLQESWIIGDISTLDDPDQVTTIDLRKESNLLTQVNKLLAGIPEVFYREGVEILGYRSLDVGRFMQNSRIQALSSALRSSRPTDNEKIHWITDLSYQENLETATYAVNALGGNVTDNTGENRVINLGDAVSATPTLLLDSEFPIIEDLAERSWATLNYRDYGRVGGRVLSTVETGVSTYFGDQAGAGVEQNFWILHTFVPFPGLFESFSLWFGAVSANAVGLTAQWVLQEIDLSDYQTVLADNLLSGTLVMEAAHANTIHKFVPDSDYELEQGKLYGIAIGFETAPAPDIAFVNLKTRTASISLSFRLQRATNRPTTAALWNNVNNLGYIEVITSPIDAPLADFVGETAPKYAPKNTGANSSLAEIQAAGAALYQWSKAFLMDRVPEIKSFNMAATGSREFPKAGDTIYVNSKARGQYIHPITRVITPTMREVIADLRVDRVQADIEGEAVRLSYELMNGTGIPRTDLITDLYDETAPQEPAQGDVAVRPWALLLDTLSEVIGPISPNSTMSDGTLAYRVSISIFDGSYASRPNDVENVYLAGLPYGTISPGGELRVEMVQLPSIENPEVIFDIALRTRDWEYGDVATITVKQVWR